MFNQNIKNLKCPNCKNSFISKNKLRKHIKTKHGILCPNCDKKFVKMRDLNQHISAVHNIKLKKTNKVKIYSKLDPRSWKIIEQKNKSRRNIRKKYEKELQSREENRTRWPKIDKAIKYSEKVNNIIQKEYYKTKKIQWDLHGYELW